MNEPGAWAAAWRAGLRAARQNAGAGVAVWALGTAVVGSYYFAPPARALWERLADFRETWGFLYSAVATSFFGGVFPLLCQKYFSPAAPRSSRGVWIFAVVFWGYKGVEVDLFYHVQSWLFGAEAGAGMLVRKVVFDMFVYCPLWAVPMTAAAYVWKETGFDWARARALWGAHGYREFALPALVSNWLIWFPTVCLIYLLPLPLQVPLFNLVLFLFVLILTVLMRRK